jgi:hypothetical protein
MTTYNNSYLFVLMRSLDMLTCSWLWRDYDITVSSMTGLALRKPSPPRWARLLGAFLNWLQTNHCEMAIACDILRCSQADAILTGRADALPGLKESFTLRMGELGSHK